MAQENQDAQTTPNGLSHMHMFQKAFLLQTRADMQNIARIYSAVNIPSRPSLLFITKYILENKYSSTVLLYKYISETKQKIK